MVAHFDHDPKLEGLPTITVRQLGRNQLGIHKASLRQRNIRNEEHEFFHESHGFRTRHRDSPRRCHGHGQKIRRRRHNTTHWREELPRQWFQPRHDYSQGYNMDGGTIVKTQHNLHQPMAARILRYRILPIVLGRLRKAISFWQVGDAPSLHETRISAMVHGTVCRSNLLERSLHSLLGKPSSRSKFHSCSKSTYSLALLRVIALYHLNIYPRSRYFRLRTRHLIGARYLSSSVRN